MRTDQKLPESTTVDQKMTKITQIFRSAISEDISLSQISIDVVHFILFFYFILFFVCFISYVNALQVVKMTKFTAEMTNIPKIYRVFECFTQNLQFTLFRNVYHFYRSSFPVEPAIFHLVAQSIMALEAEIS